MIKQLNNNDFCLIILEKLINAFNPNDPLGTTDPTNINKEFKALRALEALELSETSAALAASKVPEASNSDSLYTISVDHKRHLLKLIFSNKATTSINKPIYLLNNLPIKYKLILEVAANSKVKLIDHKIRQNSNTEIICQPNTMLNYYLIQEQDNSTINLKQAEHSNFNGRFLANSHQDNNLKFFADLLESGATIDLKILQHTKLQANNSIELWINHVTTTTKSNIIARVITDQRSKASLIGKIIVAKHAVDTDANLQSKGLIISKYGSIINRPELIIDNNQVKCAHGVSIGELDPNALFYMQARGIELPTAINILVAAFKEPILNCIEYPEILNYLDL